jgi:hypothetical protein
MRRLIPLVLGLVWTAGCPLFDDDDSGGDYVSIEQLANAYKDAYCTYLVRCGMFPDHATCAGSAVIGSSFGIDVNVIAAVYAGRVRYNGSNAHACLAAIAGNTCDKTDEIGRVTPRACLELIDGTVDHGGACMIDEECVSGTCNNPGCGQACCAGTCVGSTPPSREPVAIGEPCSSSLQCVAGAYCDLFVSGECTALKLAGVECYGQDECAYGLGCTSDASGFDTCKPLPAVGQPCPYGDCRDDGTVCDTSLATPACVQVGLPPAPCTSNWQCSPYYRCDLALGQCAKLPGLNEGCSSTHRCIDADTYCDNATLVCTATKADGQPCNSDGECRSRYCDHSGFAPVCATPVPCS